MKIAMLGHKRIPSREGGVEIVVEELATRLVNKGYEVDVYNRRGNNVLNKNIKTKKIKKYKGINIKTIFTINKKGIDALIYSFLASIRVAFGKYDCIHYHAEGSCAMIWIPHFLKKRTVVTIHGLDWQRAKWGGFATKYIKFGEKCAAKYADEIIVISKNVQKYFKDTYNRETVFIENGVNKPVHRAVNIIRKKYDLHDGEYILYLARIVPEKRLDLLIDAFSKIKTNKKLVIAGGASHTNDFMQEIKEKAKKDKRILMTGFVQGEELEELFSNAYLYCLPSDIEGMPISLMEAMSYGRNCLVSDIEENVQVCGEYGFIFRKSDLDDLTNKLNLCLNGRNRFEEKVISDYILEKYNWDNVVEKTEKLYRSIL